MTRAATMAAARRRGPGRVARRSARSPVCCQVGLDGSTCRNRPGRDQGVVIVRTCACRLDGCGGGVIRTLSAAWVQARSAIPPRTPTRLPGGQRQAADGEVVGEVAGQNNGVDGVLPVGYGVSPPAEVVVAVGVQGRVA